MPNVKANGIQIEYETFGDPSARPLLLIIGLGAQLIEWHEYFCDGLAEKLYDRSFYPQGTGRQLLAVMTQENRKPALSSVTAPTLVIHGSDDPLVPLECGRDTADAIPGAELLIIEGMGHELPPGNGWPKILEAIAIHTNRYS